MNDSLIRLVNDSVRIEIFPLGASLHRFEVRLADGSWRNIVLGYLDPDGYRTARGKLGMSIGRYANRISHARFTLAGVEYPLDANEAPNQLHGGSGGFHTRMWEVTGHGADWVELTLLSADGDQGFPGTVEATVRYRVEGDTVSVAMSATTDATTVVNLTNHAYLNLGGEGAGTIDEHVLLVESDEYTPVDATGIPLGEHASVDGTPFDFREPAAIGPAVRADHPQVVAARGIDHNYVVRGSGLRRAAVLESRRTQTRVELWSDQPGLQVYTGNFLDGSLTGKGGTVYGPHAGFCLETQHFPDSPNQPGFPSAILRPGEVFRSSTVYRFGVRP